MLYHPELWTEFDMAWILYAMRKRRLTATNEENYRHVLWAKAGTLLLQGLQKANRPNMWAMPSFSPHVLCSSCHWASLASPACLLFFCEFGEFKCVSGVCGVVLCSPYFAIYFCLRSCVRSGWKIGYTCDFVLVPRRRMLIECFGILLDGRMCTLAKWLFRTFQILHCCL